MGSINYLKSIVVCRRKTHVLLLALGISAILSFYYMVARISITLDSSLSTRGKDIQVGQFVIRDEGVPVTIAKYQAGDKNEYEYYLIGVAMMRNKGEHLVEWLEFHLLQGFDKFIIYNHLGTDDTPLILAPYIKLGLVELVTWPIDFEAVNAGKTGPRVWPDDTLRVKFEKVYYEECLEIKDTWHLHGGCQRSAMMDAVARYRYRTEWISMFDVDEFFYSPETGKETGDISSITTVREVLATKGAKYDHIIIPGKIFGTSGYFEKPVRKAGLKNRLTSEAYRFRMNFENKTRIHESYISNKHYCEKSFVRARMASWTLIHHFTFEGQPVKPRQLRYDHNFLSLNHYQFLSHLDQNKKALDNTNWALDYWRPVDMFWNEIPDFTIGYLLPVVQFNMARRETHYTLDSVSLQELAFINQAIKRKRNALVNPPELCIAFTHIDGESHHLRRSISTILEHITKVEPDVTYKTVLVMVDRPEPGNTLNREIDYLQDIHHLIDQLDILPSFTFWTKVFDRAAELCKDTKFTLYMEDKWETRIKTNSLADYTRPGLALPLLRQSMQLMEHDEHILEVWVGDTPWHPQEYKQVRSRWMKARFIPELDKTDSNFKVLRKQNNDNKLRDAIWEQQLIKYLKEFKVVRRFGNRHLEEYRQTMEQKTGFIQTIFSKLFRRSTDPQPTNETSVDAEPPNDDKTITGDADEPQLNKTEQVVLNATQNKTIPDASQDIILDTKTGYTNNTSKSNATTGATGGKDVNTTTQALANATTPKNVNQTEPAAEAKQIKTGNTTTSTNATTNEPKPKPSPVPQIIDGIYIENPELSRKRQEMATSFEEKIKKRLMCFPQKDCISHINYYRTQGSSHGRRDISGLGVVRLGGTIKHNGRLAKLMSWTEASDNSASDAEMDIQDYYGRQAMKMGFKSAHFCLTSPIIESQCDIDPDFLGLRSVTGIMWRQRLIIGKERQNIEFADRSP